MLKMNRNAMMTMILSILLLLALSMNAFAEDETPAAENQDEQASSEDTDSPSLVSPQQSPEDVQAQLELEKVKLATEQARAEAAKAKAEAEKAKLEAEKSRLELEKSRRQTEEAKLEAQKDEIPDEDKPGYHTHDGLFLRLSAGFGYSGISSNGQLKTGRTAVKTDPSHNGGAGSFNFSIGGSITENLALHADLWCIGDHMGEDDDSFNTGGLGFGMTYYFMPYNIYLTGSIGPSAIVYRDGDYEWDNTDAAYGLWTSVSVGKEWWVSANWGLGLALKGNYAYARNEDISYHQGGAMLMFSATFN